RPALVIAVVDRDALALERLGGERRVGRWRASQRRLWLRDLTHMSVDEARGLDLAGEVARREIRAGRCDARIVRGHLGLEILSVALCQQRIERAGGLAL